MKGKCHSEEQIIAILQQSEAGMKTTSVCRQVGVSAQTLYGVIAKYGGLEACDPKKLRHLEHENRQLKQVVAELTLDNRILRDINSRNWEGLQRNEEQLEEDGVTCPNRVCRGLRS